MRYLEADYSKRMVAEHADERGLFGKIEHTLELTEGEQTAERLEEFMGVTSKLIEDDSVLK